MWLVNILSCWSKRFFYLSLVAQCLHTVTEDNVSAAQLICGSSDMMKTLEKSLMADGSSSDMLLLKVLTAGNTQGMYLISSNNSPL